MIRFERAVESDYDSFAKKFTHIAIFIFVILAMILNVSSEDYIIPVYKLSKNYVVISGSNVEPTETKINEPSPTHQNPTEFNSSNEKPTYYVEISEAMTNLKKVTTQNTTSSAINKIGNDFICSNSIENLERIFNVSFANLESKLLSQCSSNHILFDHFTNRSYVLSDKIENVEISLNNLVRRVENIEKLLQRFENEMLIKEKEQEKINLPDECIKEIETYRFDRAEKKLSAIDDVSEIFYIVRKVYNNQANNFNILMKFGEAIQNVGRRLFLYKALYNELNNNGHHDSIKLLRLIRSLNEKIILTNDSSRNEGKLKEEAESLIRTSTKDFINLLSDKEMDPKSVVELAFGIKALLSYESLDSDLKQQIETIKDKLPKSVKNMAFLSKVCFLGVKLGGFVIAAEQKNPNVDVRVRIIHSSPCKNDWTFEHISHNVVRINNHVVNGSYYLSDEKAGDYNNLPLLFAKVRRHDLGKVIFEDEKWIVEPIVDNIRLKNVAKNRYDLSFRRMGNNSYELDDLSVILPSS